MRILVQLCLFGASVYFQFLRSPTFCNELKQFVIQVYKKFRSTEVLSETISFLRIINEEMQCSMKKAHPF